MQLHIAFNATLAARRFQNVFTKARRASGKGDVRISLLYFLEAAPKGLTQTELADRLEISGPSLTRQLDKLEALGLVSRRRIIGDGRFRLIVMEPAGHEALMELDVLASAMRDRLFADVPDADLETTQRVMEILTARLATDPGPVPEQP